MNIRMVTDTDGRFNSKNLSYSVTRDFPVENTAYVHLYQGRGFTQEDLKKIKQHEVQRWRIRAWDRCKSDAQVWAPEDFDPVSLRYALNEAERVLIDLPDPGPGPVDAFEEDWDHHQIDDDDGEPIVPKRAVSLSFPLRAMGLWRPILRRWTKPDCPVGLPHRDEDGGFNISDAGGWR